MDPNSTCLCVESTSDESFCESSISTIPEAVKFVQTHKLIPAVPKFITEGLTTDNVLQFHQWLQAGVLGSFNIEVIQGLVQIEYDPNTGGVVLRITQLIAGFLIGPRGLSIRDLAQGTGCVIKSWIEDSSLECPRDTRVFVLEGSPCCVLMCLDVVIAAIDRYRDLAEGKWRGQYVNKTQKIKGFIFVYYPPPKDRVPMAAGIKGFPTSSKQAMSARSLLGLNGCSRGNVFIPASNSDMQGVSEEIDDLKATYPGIYPGRIYSPKPSTRNMLQPFYPAPSNYFSLYPKDVISTTDPVHPVANNHLDVLGPKTMPMDAAAGAYGPVPLSPKFSNQFMLSDPAQIPPHYPVQGSMYGGQLSGAGVSRGVGLNNGGGEVHGDGSNQSLHDICKYLSEVMQHGNNKPGTKNNKATTADPFTHPPHSYF
eukprot:TRINITY_DN1211_c0_g1_i1.p1 TRINITY_DN1211_c0_g1~~TRINITY_DN1211_c0_g1_i1.p1  ORF type:complete len:424 (-),score=72.75 TRINITY_DN1211_c0_g1_i1:782-2053(-)